MSRFNGHKYTFTPSQWDSERHYWELRGPEGGIQFIAGIHKTSKYPPSCALEVHRCSPAPYQQGAAPHHIDCPVTGGRCWHDGTSLYASETLWPTFEQWLREGDHAAIFRTLELEYDSRFHTEDDA